MTFCPCLSGHRLNLIPPQGNHDLADQAGSRFQCSVFRRRDLRLSSRPWVLEVGRWLLDVSLSSPSAPRILTGCRSSATGGPAYGGQCSVFRSIVCSLSPLLPLADTRRVVSLAGPGKAGRLRDLLFPSGSCRNPPLADKFFLPFRSQAVNRPGPRRVSSLILLSTLPSLLSPSL